MLPAAVPTASAFVLGGWDVLLRLAAAAGLGSVIGFERELHEREAGMRTHLLVALGSCLFTLVGAYGFDDVPLTGAREDPTRIAAQVVTGIGFIGAGAILREGLSVRGLTTAGSLWVVAAIGLACGTGAYWPAIAAAALTLFALWPLRRMVRGVADHETATRLVIELPEGRSVLPVLEQLGDLHGVEIADREGRRLVTVELSAAPAPELLERIASLEGVGSVQRG